MEKEKSCPTFVYFIQILSLGFVFSISVQEACEVKSSVPVSAALPVGDARCTVL